eukprot:3555800-Amphidinium_carterae.1
MFIDQKTIFKGLLANSTGHPDKSSPFNYFSFMPRFIGRAQPGQGPLSFQSRCWKTVTVECTAKSSSGYNSVHKAYDQMFPDSKAKN